MSKKEWFLFFFIIVYIFSFSYLVSAQGNGDEQAKRISLPETIKEGISFLVRIFELLPKAIMKTWQEALEFYKRMYQKLIEIWNRFIGGRLARVVDFLQTQFQKRSSIFKIELKKEIQELKEDFIRFFKNIFDKIF